MHVKSFKQKELLIVRDPNSSRSKVDCVIITTLNIAQDQIRLPYLFAFKIRTFFQRSAKICIFYDASTDSTVNRYFQTQLKAPDPLVILKPKKIIVKPTTCICTYMKANSIKNIILDPH